MESALYSIWSIDVQNLVRNKFILCREYHIQPSEIDRMYYFEYEMLIDEVKEYVKEQNKQRSKEEASQPNYGQMMRQQRSMMNSSAYKPSMPSMPKMSMPSFK